MSTVEFSFDSLSSAAQSMSPAAIPTGPNYKGFFKRALVNLLIIVFMFGFVELYNICFGQGNGLIGLTIALAIISFYRIDIGIKPLQGALVIFFVFLLTGASTFLSSFHPLLGLVINCSSIYTILTLTSHQPMTKPYYPILSCYLFAQGSPVYGIDYGFRMLGIACGGLVVSIFYFIRHRNIQRKRGILDIFHETHFCSIRTKFFIRLTMGLTLAMLISDLFHAIRPAWISFTVLSLVHPFVNESRKKIVYRIIGTIIGGILFFILFEWIIPQSWHPALLLLSGYIYLFLRTYWIQQIFVTLSSLSGAMVFLQADTAFELRILFVLIGIGIVIFISLCAKLRLMDRIYGIIQKIKTRNKKSSSI